MNEIKEKLKPDFPDPLVKWLMTTESTYKSFISNKLMEEHNKKIKDRIKDTKVKVPYKLTTDEENNVVEDFPEFDIEFSHSTKNSHAAAATYRRLNNEILLKKTHYHKFDNETLKKIADEEGKDVFLKDIGGNFLYYFDRNSGSVHCCCPLIDHKDDLRWEERLTNVKMTLKDPLRNLTTDQKITASDCIDVAEGVCDATVSICKLKASDCDCTALFAVLQDSCYDIKLRELGDALTKSSVKIAYGAYIFVPEMLQSFSGKIPQLGVVWMHVDKNGKDLDKTDDAIGRRYHDVSEIMAKSHTIRFSFSGDSTYNYEHKTSEYFSYALVKNFSDAEGNRYAIELQENRGGYQHYKINRVERDERKGRCEVDVVRHDLWVGDHGGMRLITSLRHNDAVTTTNLRPPSVYTDNGRKNQWCHDDDLAGLEVVQFWAPTELVEKALSYAQGVTETKFKPEEIFNFIKSINSRNPTANGISLPEYRLTHEEMALLTTVIYITVYDSKYRNGKVVQQLISDINVERSFEYAGICDSFLQWIFGNNSYRNIIKAKNDPKWYHRLFGLVLKKLCVRDLIVPAPNRITISSNSSSKITVSAKNNVHYVFRFNGTDRRYIQTLKNIVLDAVSPMAIDKPSVCRNEDYSYIMDMTVAGNNIFTDEPYKPSEEEKEAEFIIGEGSNSYDTPMTHLTTIARIKPITYVVNAAAKLDSIIHLIQKIRNKRFSIVLSAYATKDTIYRIMMALPQGVYLHDMTLTNDPDYLKLIFSTTGNPHHTKEIIVKYFGYRCLRGDTIDEVRRKTVITMDNVSEHLSEDDVDPVTTETDVAKLHALANRPEWDCVIGVETKNCALNIDLTNDCKDLRVRKMNLLHKNSKVLCTVLTLSDLEFLKYLKYLPRAFAVALPISASKSTFVALFHKLSQFEHVTYARVDGVYVLTIEQRNSSAMDPIIDLLKSFLLDYSVPNQSKYVNLDIFRNHYLFSNLVVDETPAVLDFETLSATEVKLIEAPIAFENEEIKSIEAPIGLKSEDDEESRCVDFTRSNSMLSVIDEDFNIADLLPPNEFRDLQSPVVTEVIEESQGDQTGDDVVLPPFEVTRELPSLLLEVRDEVKDVADDITNEIHSHEGASSDVVLIEEVLLSEESKSVGIIEGSDNLNENLNDVIKLNGCTIRSLKMDKKTRRDIYRRAISMPGDGNCLYYALSRTSDVDAKSLREHLMKMDNGEHDEKIFVGFGGLEVCEVYAKCMLTKIIVYDMDNLEAIHIEPPVFSRTTEVIFSKAHYDSVKSLTDTMLCEVSSEFKATINATHADVCNLNEIRFRRRFDKLAQRVLKRCKNSEIFVALTSERPPNKEGYSITKMTRSGVELWRYKIFSKDTVRIQVRGGNKITTQRTSSGYLVTTPIKNEKFVTDLTQTRVMLDCVYDRIPATSQVVLDLATLVNVEVIVKDFNKREFDGVVEFKNDDDDSGPVYEAGLSNLARIKSSMNEVLWLWKTQKDSVKNNINPNHTLAVEVGANARIDDVSFGLIDIVNGTWIIKPSGTKDIQMVYDGNDFLDASNFIQEGKIIKANSEVLSKYPKLRYVSFNRDTKLMITDRLYHSAKNCRFTDDDLTDLKVTIFNSGPGVGKTKHVIDNHDPHNDLVLTNTKEALNDVRSRAMSIHDEEQFNFNEIYRTGDSFLINNNGKKKYKKIWIDEGFMKHCGEWFWYAVAAKAKHIIIMGDSAQIPYIERSGREIHYAFYNQVFETECENLEVKHLNVTKRCPRDITTWLNDNGSYPFQMSTTSEVTKSVGINIITGVNDIKQGKDRKKTKFLTFTQAEKQELSAKGYDASTIHEYQGNQCNTVVLVRLNPKVNPVYKSKPHILVAITRHTNNFLYCTVVRDDMTAVVELIQSYPYSRLNKVFSRLQGGYVTTERPMRFFAEMDDGKAVVMYREDKVARRFVQNHYETGYVAPRPKFFEIHTDSFCDDRNTELVPIYDVSSPLNILQYVVDNILPGTSTEFVDYDAYLYHHNCENYMSPDLMLREDFRNPKFYEPYMLPRLRATVPVPVRGNQKEVVKAFMERNGAVPDLAHIVDVDNESDLMVHEFINTYVRDVELLSRYRDETINVNTKSLERWFQTQPPNIKNILGESELVVFDIDNLNEYDYILKRVGKIDLEINAEYRNKSPQTIAHLAKEVNALFCPIVKDMKERLSAVLADNVILNMDRSLGSFEEAVTLAMIDNFGNYNPKHLEVDFSKYDKSQNLLTLYYEIKMMRLFGVPELFLDMWMMMHVVTDLLNKNSSFKARVRYQRKSGDAMTYLGNTLFLMAVMNRVFRLDSSMVMLFSGDDSLIFAKEEFNSITLMDAVDKFAFKYNLEAKLLKYDYPYFCSKFLLYQPGIKCTIVADPLKIVVKMGRKDLVSPEHVEMYRISLLDNIQCYADYSVWHLLDEAFSGRYGNVIDVGYVLNSIITLVVDKGKFLNLFEINPDVKFINCNIMPSLDI